jgi:hypothetical protein
MPPVGFELPVSAGKRPQTYALDRAATGIIIYLEKEISDQCLLSHTSVIRQNVQVFCTGVFLSVSVKVKDAIPESKIFRKETVCDIPRRESS